MDELIPQSNNLEDTVEFKLWHNDDNNQVYIIAKYKQIILYINPDRKFLYRWEKGEAGNIQHCIVEFMKECYKRLSPTFNKYPDIHVIFLYDTLGKQLSVYNSITFKLKDLRKQNLDLYHKIHNLLLHAIQLFNKQVDNVTIKYKKRDLIITKDNKNIKLNAFTFSVEFNGVHRLCDDKLLSYMDLVNVYNTFMIKIFEKVDL